MVLTNFLLFRFVLGYVLYVIRSTIGDGEDRYSAKLKGGVFVDRWTCTWYA